ncbi:hypothetical protein P6F26_14240 [Roseibacterium sp. SDUM158017]|nr:hypothetical protein [Roseibacterium sp. SDUM158017]MDG4649600.1 hypothetical protein [Roseibacterium sp. SDUM158017]
MTDRPHILIVEDNILIAMDMEQMILDQGCVPVGPVSNVAAGLEAIARIHPDGAVLDVNLGDERVWPLAEALDRRGIPFALTTGYSSAEIPDAYRDRLILEKPVAPETLSKALAMFAPGHAGTTTRAITTISVASPWWATPAPESSKRRRRARSRPPRCGSSTSARPRRRAHGRSKGSRRATGSRRPEQPQDHRRPS